MEAHWEVTLGGQDFGIMVEKVLEWVGSWKKAPILQHIFFFESHVECHACSSISKRAV